MKPHWWQRRSVKLAAALVLLAALYRAADWRAVGHVLTTLDRRYLLAALALFLPQTFVSAWRWRMLVARLRGISCLESLRQTAIASAWNLIVPSKLGDLSKAALIPELNAAQRTAASGLVLLEKLTDVAALGTLILLGASAERMWGPIAVTIFVSGFALFLARLIQHEGAWGWGAFRRPLTPEILGHRDGLHDRLTKPQRPEPVASVSSRPCPRHPLLRFMRKPSSDALGGGATRRSLAARIRVLPVAPRQLALLAASTFALWCLHLWQIELFMRAAGVFVPWDLAAARLPVAIFAGLAPVSFCGVGTRDAALVWLFADVAPPSAMAAVGLLTALRYLVPGTAGIAVLAADRAAVGAPVSR